MIGSIGAAAIALWGLALAAFFLVVVPTIVLEANRVISAIRQIRDYAGDILEHGLGLAANLDAVPALVTTRELVGDVGVGVGRYGAALDAIIESSKP